MTDQKQSQFTEVQELIGTDYVPAFGQSSNKKISKTNLFDQIREETQIFIYPTTELLKAANLVADPDWPVYVENAETGYRLYQITSLAAGPNDIVLNNGLTATFRVQYSDIGYVVGPSPSIDGAMAVFDGVTGTQLENGPVVSTIGSAFVSTPNSAVVGYPRKNSDNTLSMLSGNQLKTDLSLDQVNNTSDANKPISIAEQAQLDARPFTIDYFATLATTPATPGQQVWTKGHSVKGRGANKFQAYSGATTNDGGTKSPSATVGVYWAMVQNGPLSVEDFGVLGSDVRASTVNEYTGMQNALNAAQNSLNNTLVWPCLYYKTATTLTIVKPVHIEGQRPYGLQYPGTDMGGTVGILSIIGTQLDWAGPTTDPCIFINKSNAGGSIKNMTIDGNYLCTYCVHADTIIYWNFENLWCRNARVFSFYLDARFGSCSWNTFRQLRCSVDNGFNSTACLALGGYAGAFNTCHNTFIQTTIEHSRDSYGMLLGFCDNNTFLDTYILTDNSLIGPTAYGVTYTPSGGLYAYGNLFVHLQAGNKGYYEPPGSYGGNQAIATIIGYATDNAQPLPIRATFTSGGSTYAGTHISFLSGDVWGVRTHGIGNADSALTYAMEIRTPGVNSRGTELKLGQSNFHGTYDDQAFDLTGCHINQAGTVISDNGTAGSGSGSGFRNNGSTLTGYCFTSLTINTAVTLNAAAQAFEFTNSGGNWTFGFNGVAPSLRDAGYGTPTNTAKIVSFNAATVTLPQTAGILGALIIELKNKGLIGA